MVFALKIGKKTFAALILAFLAIAAFPIIAPKTQVNAQEFSVSLTPPGPVLVGYNSSATFTAVVSNGVSPYKYLWFFTLWNGTKVEITDAENETSWTTWRITQNGNYTVTANVTDSTGENVVDLAVVKLNTKIVILPVENTFNASEMSPGSHFIVNATVVDVADLWTWQIKLTWNISLLQFVNITRPLDDVFSQISPPRSIITPPPIVDEDPPGTGYVMWGATYTNAPYWTFNGTGTLCQIAFRISAPPLRPSPSTVTCNLTLVEPIENTFLQRGWPGGVDIPFTVEDGVYSYFDNLSVSLSPSTEQQVEYGGTVDFTATAVNGSEPHRYRWFFTYPNGTQIEAEDAENQTSWTCYPINITGTHKVTINVTDSAGATAAATTNVRIKSLSVVLAPSYPVVEVNNNVTFTATTSGGIPPYNIKWYRNGTEDTSVEDDATVMFNFTQVGRETVRVTVTDSMAGSTFQQTDVKILATPTTTLKITPEPATYYTNMTRVGGTIVINVTVQGVTDLQNWQVKVTWDPTLLNFSAIGLPSDHVFSPIDSAINPGAPGARAMTQPPEEVGPGSVFWGCTYTNDPYWTFNGTGTLCQINLTILFQPAPVSTCSIKLINQYVDTFLLNGAMDDISFSPENATYSYILVSPVAHQLYDITFLTYTNTSIIANSTDHMPMPEAWIDMLEVTGAPGTGAWVNFTLPKALIKLLNPTDQWIVRLDGVDVTSQAVITQTATHTYIYLAFTFTDYDRVIRVDGTWMVPEQIHILLIALLIASLIAVILTKTSTKKKLVI